MKRYLSAMAAAMCLAVAGFASAQPQTSDSQKYPDVLSVKVKACGKTCFDFDVTISSPYDTPQRYADAFRVMSAEGQPYGERILLHDHANEQPFTRDLYGVSIPSEVRVVVVQARDQKFGYGGKIVQVELPGR
jgi:hypothetical protein